MNGKKKNGTNGKKKNGNEPKEPAIFLVDDTNLRDAGFMHPPRETYVAEKDVKYGSMDKTLIVTTLPDNKAEYLVCPSSLVHFLKNQVNAKTNTLVLVTPYETVTAEVADAISELRAKEVRVRIVFLMVREENVGKEK